MKIISRILLVLPVLAFASDSLESIRTKHSIPAVGTSVLQMSSPESARIEVAGFRKLGDPTAVEVSDAWHLGSCTKAMTAYLIAIAVSEKKFTYESRLGDLFPGTHPSQQDSTVQDPIGHVAGIGDHRRYAELPDEDIFQWDLPRQREWLAQELTKLPFMTGPKTKYVYSNLGYTILGHLLERSYGVSYEELAKQRVFDKLGMKSCAFGPVSRENETQPSTIWGHDYDAKTGALNPLHFDNFAFLAPAGTAHCSLVDWGKFADLILRTYRGQNAELPESIANRLFQVISKTDSDVPYTAGAWLDGGTAENPYFAFVGSNTLNLARINLFPRAKKASLVVINAASPSAETALEELSTTLK